MEIMELSGLNRLIRAIDFVPSLREIVIFSTKYFIHTEQGLRWWYKIDITRFVRLYGRLSTRKIRELSLQTIGQTMDRYIYYL